MYCYVVQIYLSFSIGAERIEMSTLTVRLTESAERDLLLACEQTGKSKSEVVRELLADSLRTYRLRQALLASQSELGGAARQAGWLTEDDILADAL
jgi:Arc/MetJ-type ribon-helix-helix transcriptional regulator